MTEVVANNHNATITTNDFALVANLFHARFDLHDYLSNNLKIKNYLFVTINNSTSGEVIRTKFYDHFIFWQNTNVVLSHLSTDMC